MSDDNPMAASMKTMTYTMPLISVVFGFTLPGRTWFILGSQRGCTKRSAACGKINICRKRVLMIL